MANLTFQWEGDINVVGGEVKKDGVPIGAGSSGTTIEDIKGNYIDNSNFSINTNGEEEYIYTDTTIYTVDRWYIDGGILTPKGNGVQFTNTNTDSGTENLIRLKQNIPYSFDIFAGKTLTLSAKINGTIYSGAATLPEEKPTTGTDSTTAVQYIAVGTTNFGVNLNYSITGDYFVPYIALAYNQSALIEWMKLEIGDSATPYVAPDYATEKIKTEFMSDNGNISMPYTQEEVDNKVEEIETQVAGINAASLMIKVNNKDFKHANGQLKYEPFHIVGNIEGNPQGKIIEIDNYYFVNGVTHLSCYEGVTGIKENSPRYTVNLLGNGIRLTNIRQVAIIPREEDGVYQIYVVQNTELYTGNFRIEELQNELPLVLLNIEMNMDFGRLVYSRKKVYVLPTQGANILIYPNGTDYMTGKELVLLGAPDNNAAIDIECSMEDDLFVLSSSLTSWGWCDQSEDGALVFGMCRIENGEMAGDYIIRKIFKWGNYIIGQNSYESGDGQLYYWTTEDYNSDNVILDADMTGQPLEQRPSCWIGVKALPVPTPDSSSMGTYAYNFIGTSKNYFVISGVDFTGIYRNVSDLNFEKLELGQRLGPIWSVIEDSEYLFIFAPMGQYRIPYRTYEISLEEAINRLS